MPASDPDIIEAVPDGRLPKGVRLENLVRRCRRTGPGSGGCCSRVLLDDGAG